MDQVIPIRPGIGPDPVLVVAVGLGKMRNIDPVAGPALAITRARQETGDNLLISIGRAVFDEGLDLGGGRWEAGQVEIKAPDEGSAGSFRK